MLIDYEEDDIFNVSINSKLDEQINRSPISSKSSLSSSHYLSKSNYSLDEIENETSIEMTSKLNNTHLLKLLSELVRTFFEITHEIEFCLNCYINKQKLNLVKHVKSSDQLNELTDFENNKIFNISKSSSFTSYSTKTELNNLNNNLNNFNQTTNQANLQINHFDDEIVCENVLPFRKPKQIKSTLTQSNQFNNNDSLILKESNTINNSNYFEISCSYIVQLNNFKNSNSKNQSIVEDKKTYISANINVNNCYKSKQNRDLIKKNSSIDSEEEDEAYSDATTDFSDNVEFPCQSYNFTLKNRPISSQNNHDDYNNSLKNDNKLQIEPTINNQTNEQEFKEFIDQKMMIFNQSLINLTKCDNLIDCKNLDKIEINKLDSNYSDYLEEEDLVVALCTSLKELIKELIQLMGFISTGDLDNTLKDLLNKNSDLNLKLINLKMENKQIEDNIKLINQKESDFNIEIINLKHFLNEYKQNQERIEWLRIKLEDLKGEINQSKKEKENHELLKKEMKVEEEEEIFQDCLDKLEEDLENNNNLDKYLDNKDESAEQSLETVLFDRIQFEDLYKSIQYSSNQQNMIYLIDDEKYELNRLINNLKNEIERLILNNEALNKLKKSQFEDYNQHLNCLKKLIFANRKFLNEQIMDRDTEKDVFDIKLTRLNCLIKENDLSLSKFNEKCEFLKCDLDDLSGEKDELQCKNYNQGRKLIDVLSKQDDLKQEIDKLQDENNINFFKQEQLRKKLEESEKNLDKAKVVYDKLKFDDKIELDENFFRILDEIMKEINKYHMQEKIRDHLNSKKLVDKNISNKNQKQLNNLKKSKTFVKTPNHKNDLVKNSLTPIKPNNQPIILRKNLKSKDFSTPIRTNSFSLHNKVSPIKTNQSNNLIPRSKSFMLFDNEFDQLTKLNRRSLKLTDESFSNFLSKLKNPKNSCLDDEEFYSFKECQSLISLNNDLDNFGEFKSEDSLYSLKSSVLDHEEKEENESSNDETINISNIIDAKRSLSEDTFYFSLTSDDVNNELFNSNLNELYLQLEKCKDGEKLKYYACVIMNFFQQITKNINESKDTLQNLKLINNTKRVKLAELENTNEQLKSLHGKETINLENLQNQLNSKHLEISELKDQIDSNQDNSLFIENKQVLQKLDQRMIENEESQFILQDNLEHLEENLKRKKVEFNYLNDQLVNSKKKLDLSAEKNQLLDNENKILEKENLELVMKIKKLREAKLYKKLQINRKD